MLLHMFFASNNCCFCLLNIRYEWTPKYENFFCLKRFKWVYKTLQLFLFTIFLAQYLNPITNQINFNKFLNISQSHTCFLDTILVLTCNYGLQSKSQEDHNRLLHGPLHYAWLLNVIFRTIFLCKFRSMKECP